MSPRLIAEQHTISRDALRIAIVSDTHAYLDARIEQLIAECDYAIHAGDVMDARILARMRPRQQLFAVAGNNDEQGVWCGKEERFTRRLPDIVELELPSGRICVEHGHRFGFAQPDHEGLRAAHPEARLVIYGHTHKQLIDQSRDPWIANPGLPE